MRPTQPTIFITGAGRGLGLATALLAIERGYQVVATVRNSDDQRRLEADLNDHAQAMGSKGRARVLMLDGSNPSAMPAETREALKNCDILVNNIGIAADVGQAKITIGELDENVLREAFDVNALLAHHMMTIALPGMKQRGWGRVVNVSSERAWLSTYTGDRLMPAYRLSKLLLNGLTVWTAREYEGSGVLVNSVCPGWCRTDMGSQDAPDSAEQGATKILQLGELPDNGPSGQFFVNNQIVAF